MPGLPSGLRILVVDDDGLVRKLLQALLTGDGHLVEVAENPVVASTLLSAHPFDLIISDLIMPQQSGLDFARSLRTSGMQTPLLIVSGTLDDETVRACAQLSKVGCLAKPFTLDALRGSLQSLLP